MNYYTLLNIPKDSSVEKIQEAFVLFKQRTSSYGGGLKLTNDDIEKQFPEISVAFMVLLDADKKSRYDATLVVNDNLTKVFTNENVQELEETEETLPIKSKFQNLLSYIGLFILLLAVLYGFARFFSFN